MIVPRGIFGEKAPKTSGFLTCDGFPWLAGLSCYLRVLYESLGSLPPEELGRAPRIRGALGSCIGVENVDNNCADYRWLLLRL